MKLGCHGIPSIFSFTNARCGSCSQSQSCQHASYETLLSVSDCSTFSIVIAQHEKHRRSLAWEEVRLAMPHKARVSNQPKRVNAKQKSVRLELDEHQTMLVESLPSKAGRLLAKFLKKGMDVKIRSDAFRSENPFLLSKHRSLHFCFEEAMKSGGSSKGELKVALMTNLGWSEASAFSEVSIVWKLFPALGIASTEHGILNVSPNVVGYHNNSINEQKK